MDGLTFLYKTAAGRCVLKLLASRTVSKICGAFMDSPLSSFLIKGFAKKNRINCDDYELDGIKTFNQFFRRRIKDGKRPFDMNPDHLCAPCDGILMKIFFRNLGKSVKQFLRRIKIRESLREIHRFVLIGNACHTADHGIRESFCSFGKSGHSCASIGFWYYYTPIRCDIQVCARQ